MLAAAPEDEARSDIDSDHESIAGAASEIPSECSTADTAATANDDVEEADWLGRPIIIRVATFDLQNGQWRRIHVRSELEAYRANDEAHRDLSTTAAPIAARRRQRRTL